MILDIMAISLSQGFYALVDGEDYERINRHKWYAVKGNSTYYAARNIKNGKVFMHRQILGLTKGDKRQTDHINSNGLDERKSNLRICSPSENQHNRLKQKGSSAYKGVYWHKRAKKWCGQIQHDGKQIHLGSFDNEVDAAKVYDKKAREFFGKFAHTNQG